MVAVKRDALPKSRCAGGEKVTVVVDVAVAATVTVTAGEVLTAKSASPEYLAVTVLAPPGGRVVTRVATPAVMVAVPSGVVPLKN